MEIRRERPEDKQAVRAVNELAFGQAQEADIVDALRDACPGLVSLVAVLDGRVTGHILFSPAMLEDPAGVIHEGRDVTCSARTAEPSTRAG
jgi:putative acetyltransferase